MQEKIRSRPAELKKLFLPMQILIGAEIASALLLVLYISRSFHTGTLSLLGLVITLMQPKYQFGMVWEWKDRSAALDPTTGAIDPRHPQFAAGAQRRR